MEINKVVEEAREVAEKYNLELVEIDRTLHSTLKCNKWRSYF